jgi:hypothetical protein
MGLGEERNMTGVSMPIFLRIGDGPEEEIGIIDGIVAPHLVENPDGSTRCVVRVGDVERKVLHELAALIEDFADGQ